MCRHAAVIISQNRRVIVRSAAPGEREQDGQYPDDGEPSPDTGPAPSERRHHWTECAPAPPPQATGLLPMPPTPAPPAPPGVGSVGPGAGMGIRQPASTPMAMAVTMKNLMRQL